MKEISKIERVITAMPQRKRVAAYARVSMESERLMHSLSAQVSYYSTYIQKNPHWIYAGVYADSGITGTLTDRRDEFQRMLKDCEDGKIDIILVKSISRFARNTVDLLRTVRHLKELGIEVRFEKENINSMTADGELMLSILASFAQEESRSISENVKWGTRKRFEQGIPNGRVRVFGYVWQGDILVIVPAEAEIVKRIYQEFLNGKTPRKIARDLNADVITTRAGCQWSDFSIRTILKNITYTGNLLLQKEFVDDPITKQHKKNNGELPRYLAENTHEPIISKDVFDAVQEEFIKRGEKRNSIFNSKIICSICGAYYTRNSVGSGKYYKIWTCGTKRKSGCKVCGAKDIREDRLKEICIDVLNSTKFDESVFLNTVDNIYADGQTLKFYYKDGTVTEKVYSGKRTEGNHKWQIEWYAQFRLQ